MIAAVSEFKNITGYNIEKFLNDFNFFISNYYSKIVNYYKGSDIDMDSFRYFDYIYEESSKIDGLIEIYQNFFNTVDFWDLIDIYSEIKTKLLTINSLGKWLRSSRNNRFSSETVINYVQKQGESIESISLKSGSNDSENDWVDISINNDLNEEKYTSQGGAILKIKLNNRNNFEIRNVVDYFSNENLYGKDLTNKLEFISGDLNSLYGINSLFQTFGNILNTMKGSIPEFKEDGIDNDLIGSNVSIFNYPAQFRNILNMIQKDDRFKSIELLDIVRDNDMVFMKLQATSKIGDLIKRDLSI